MINHEHLDYIKSEYFTRWPRTQAGRCSKSAMYDRLRSLAYGTSRSKSWNRLWSESYVTHEARNRT